MRKSRLLHFLTAITMLTLVMVGICSCDKKEDNITTNPENLSSNSSSTETTLAPTSTSTPVPTNTSTPTPTPTPTPIYVEPIMENEIWYGNFVDPRSVRAQIVENPDDITALVNKYFSLPLDYEPEDLVEAPYSFNQMLREEACDAWILMHDACLEATGSEVILLSGYRSASTQQTLFLNSVSRRGVEFACQKNAWEGRSEHQLGLALDLVPAGHSSIVDPFDETTVGAWIVEHCYEYGFILRYPGEFSDETGYGDESWHFRYVGIELATYLTENNMSLEAYYGVEQVIPGYDE